MQETQVIHWKPNQLKFCIKIVFLSPDELTLVKQKKVICYSIKVGGLSPPHPTSAAYALLDIQSRSFLINYLEH